MAGLTRDTRGTWRACWRDAEGNLIRKATGEHNREAAQRRANQMEAEAKFWEDVEHFKTYAALNYSPRYCHDSFIAAKHIRFDSFKLLLDEAGIEFAKPNQWRDARKKGTGKRYRYKGRLLTIRELVQQPGCAVKFSTIRARLNKGMSAADAITLPPIDPRVSGLRGAEKTNNRRK